MEIESRYSHSKDERNDITTAGVTSFFGGKSGEIQHAAAQNVFFWRRVLQTGFLEVFHHFIQELYTQAT